MYVSTRAALVAALFLVMSACGAGNGGSSTGTRNSAIGSNGNSSTPPAAGQVVDFHGTVDVVVAPTFSVGTHSVTTDASTVITKDGVAATFDVITVGASVEVKGAVQADGSVLATRIELSTASGSGSSGGSHDDGDDHASSPTDTIVFEAALQSVSGDAKTLEVGDIPVTVSDTTHLVKGDATVNVADLKVGDTLVVRGVLGAGPTVAASNIRVVVPGSDGSGDGDDDGGH
jgi:hypothetical protein